MDFASTTPLCEEAFDVMESFLLNNFANPSSLYKEGVENKKAVHDARLKVARILHAKKDDIYFTGSGTESDNLALLGVFKKSLEIFDRPHIIVSKIEHPAILEVAKEVEKLGGEVTYLEVNEDGIVNPEELKSALKKETVLVSIMYANNEIGVIQPIGKISKIIKKFREENGGEYPYFHSDASQAPNYLDCNVDKLGVDLMTLDGSKTYGPKGIGCLYKKHSVKISPIIFGGGQEKGLRPGTENVAGIVGFAKSLEVANQLYESENSRLSNLQKYFIETLSREIPKAKINGSLKNRLPNNINICAEGLNAEFTVIGLDEKGIACASMTACKNLDDESSSYVIEALGKKECASSSLRFTMGRGTTKEDVDLTIQGLKDIVSGNENNNN